MLPASQLHIIQPLSWLQADPPGYLGPLRAAAFVRPGLLCLAMSGPRHAGPGWLPGWLAVNDGHFTTLRLCLRGSGSVQDPQAQVGADAMLSWWDGLMQTNSRSQRPRHSGLRFSSWHHAYWQFLCWNQTCCCCGRSGCYHSAPVLPNHGLVTCLLNKFTAKFASGVTIALVAKRPSSWCGCMQTNQICVPVLGLVFRIA